MKSFVEQHDEAIIELGKKFDDSKIIKLAIASALESLNHLPQTLNPESVLKRLVGRGLTINEIAMFHIGKAVATIELEYVSQNDNFPNTPISEV